MALRSLRLGGDRNPSMMDKTNAFPTAQQEVTFYMVGGGMAACVHRLR